MTEFDSYTGATESPLYLTLNYLSLEKVDIYDSTISRERHLGALCASRLPALHTQGDALGW